MNSSIKACLALCAALAFGCEQGAVPLPESEPAPTPAASVELRETPVQLLPADGPSLYELELPLVDQDGKPIDLDVYAGRPVIVSMFYATCPVACPLLISDIKRAVKSASPETQRELAVLMVSLDPERDTPEAMKELAEAHGVANENWRFARTTQESTRELAAVLGIKYAKLESGAIRHTSLISVLDERGVVRHRAQSPLPTDHSVGRALDAVR